MRRLLLLTLCVSSSLLATSALAAGKGGPPRANFSITIDDFMSDHVTPTAIRGDGAAYVNGADGVTISSSVLNFWPRNDLGTRNVTFGNYGFVGPSNLPAPIVNDTATPPSGTTGTNANLTDPHGFLNLATSMENMAVSARQCGTLFMATHDSASGFVWRLVNFQWASGSASSFVVVSRISSTQWTVESDTSNLCSSTSVPNNGIILHDETTTTSKGKTTTVTHADGYYSVPLHLTYTLE